jgi:hypothetical protein
VNSEKCGLGVSPREHLFKTVDELLVCNGSVCDI